MMPASGAEADRGLSSPLASSAVMPASGAEAPRSDVVRLLPGA
jgi:hypothetical protein